MCLSHELFCTTYSSFLELLSWPRTFISLYCDIEKFSGFFWIILERELQALESSAGLWPNPAIVEGFAKNTISDWNIFLFVHFTNLKAIGWLSETLAARERVSIRHTERVDGAPPPIYIISRSLPEHDVIATRLIGTPRLLTDFNTTRYELVSVVSSV